MDYSTMSPEQLAKTIEGAKSELTRRQSWSLLNDKLASLQDEFRAAGVLPVPPEQWERPAESRNAYGRGDVVDWNGGRREATAGFVVCSPECDEHWTDHDEAASERSGAEAVGGQEPVPEIVEWGPDIGTLRLNDLVTSGNKTYRVTSAHTAKDGWTPGSMPGLFEEVDNAEVS